MTNFFGCAFGVVSFVLFFGSIGSIDVGGPVAPNLVRVIVAGGLLALTLRKAGAYDSLQN